MPSSWLDLSIYQGIKDETRDNEISQDGDFPASKLIYDRRAHARHKCHLNRKEIEGFICS